MSKRGTPIYWVIIFVVLLSIPVLACNLVTGDEAPPPDATLPFDAEEPADEAQAVATEAAETEAEQDDTPAEGNGEGPALELSSLAAALEQYNSYRIRVDMRFEPADDSGEAGIIHLERAITVEPPASSTTMQFEGDVFGDVDEVPSEAQISFVELEGTTYSVLPGLGCIAGGADEIGAGAEEFDDLLDADEMTGDLDDAEYVGEDTVNGQAVYHYRFEESAVSGEDQELRDVSGDLYVSQEGNYVVGLTMEGAGAGDFVEQQNGQEGTVHLEYNVLDVGETFEIEVPEGCGESGTDFPVMDGASEVNSFAGFTSYNVDAEMADVIDFYQAEMGALDYEEGQESLVTEDSALLFYESPDGPPVTVNINVDEEGTIVLLSSEDEEAE